MKFKAEPNLFVRISSKYVQRVTGIKGFYFDDKGEYETDNETLIKLFSQSFDIDEQPKEKIKRHCKKCEFICDTQGELLKHYKTIHPKEIKK